MEPPPKPSESYAEIAKNLGLSALFLLFVQLGLIAGRVDVTVVMTALDAKTRRL